MKKRLLAMLLAGSMVIGGPGIVTAYAGVQDAEAESMAVTVSAETEEETVESLRADNGDVLTAIVPFTGEEKEAFAEGSISEDESNGISGRLLQNLAKYIPEGGELSEDEPLSFDRESFIGLDPITPAEGDVNALVLITEFENYKFTEQFKNDLKTRIFANDPKWDTTAEGQAESLPSVESYPKDSLRGYYQRASYGKLKINGEISSFVSPHTREWYEHGDLDEFDNEELYLDAVNSWVEDVLKEHDESDGKTDLEYLDERLSSFDQDHDMRIDACYFACAGGNTGWGSRWWSYRAASKIRIGSYQLSSLVQVVDSISKAGVSGKDDVADYLETFIHETGHFLGLVDYYSYDSNKSKDKVSTHAMMQDNYGEQDGFAKMLLGWIPKENVWVITDKQVYNPKEKSWQDYTGSYSLTLKPYAETGDLALIIPKRNDSEDWNWIYDQFIMAEYYKNSENDTFIDSTYTDQNGKVVTVHASDGLRLFLVYGKLNYNGTEFIGSNTKDDHIPLISDYNNPNDPFKLQPDDPDNDYKRLGVFHPGMTPAEELTPDTVPASTFLYNPSDDGLLANTTRIDSGISITNIKSAGNDLISFDTSFKETELDGPKIAENGVELLYDETNGAYIKVSFDRPVNYNGGKSAAVYDYIKAENTYLTDEKWGDITDVRYSPSGKQYLRETRDLYFMLKSEDYRFTDGTLVIPAGSVISDKGIPCQELTAYITGIQKDAAVLSASPGSGVYDKEIEVTINGAPAGSKVYYTLDGTEPTVYSIPYRGAIRIEGPVVLKAIAYKNSPDAEALTSRLRCEYTLEKVYFNDEEYPTEKAVTLDVGEAYYLNAGVWGDPDYYVNTANEDNEDNSIFTYVSSDPETVIVDTDGMVIARKEGTATVSVTTANTADTPAKCVVTVSSGVSSAVKEKVIEEYGFKKSGEVLRQISKDLNGAATLQEFGKEWLDKLWIASIPDQTYNSRAIKPGVTVYEGVKKLDASDYSVSYKKNKKAGTAKANVKFKGSYKKTAPLTTDFVIAPANVDNDLVVLDMGIKPTGKSVNPKPIILWKKTGAKQAFKASEFVLTYTNEAGEAVDGVSARGIYYATLSGKGKNFIGTKKICIKVQDNNLVEKVKIKSTHKTFEYNEGSSVIPEYGKDFTIAVPGGYESISEESFTKEVLKEICLNNTRPGKMALIITAPEESVYAGSQVVYLTIK
ncbi:MAG: chitobiase/beta-hexosaminidase C-terminal domain-containing protein [Lachnospiraceae bacterium]|nr:chitobiase/beta-hexosaminidase C-terminal domain-containing protein [Lachnospiraceae bacterium]